MTLVVPNLKDKQMGQVFTTITVTNRIDQVLADRDFISPDEIRTLTLDKVLVDTGATLLALPAQIISQLGLTQLGETNVETANGVIKGRIFRDVVLNLEGRYATFDCLEMPEVVSAVLLGVIPLERLGLEPDLKNQRLKVFPMNEEQTYLML